MKSFTKTYVINASVRSVWQALVVPKIIDDWGGGPAVMKASVGTIFSLWGGDIHGTNTKVEVDKLLVQDWYSGDWAKPSEVTFALVKKGKQTEVTLTHMNIPDGEFGDIKSGWDSYYMGLLKQFVEQN